MFARQIYKYIMIIVKFTLVVYLIFIILLYFFQRNLQYFPNNKYISPDKLGLDDVQELILPDKEGNRLIAWYGKSLLNITHNKKTAVLYFHGNASNIANEINLFVMRNFGISVMLLEYPGYGISEGALSENGLIQSGIIALKKLRTMGYSNIVLVGHSLGSGVAVQVAAKNKISKLILISAFNSAMNIAKEKYPYFPISLLMKDKFLSYEYITKVRVPLLMIHGKNDGIVKLDLAKELFKLANNPKRILLFNKGHNDILSQEVLINMINFINQ